MCYLTQRPNPDVSGSIWRIRGRACPAGGARSEAAATRNGESGRLAPAAGPRPANDLQAAGFERIKVVSRAFLRSRSRKHRHVSDAPVEVFDAPVARPVAILAETNLGFTVFDIGSKKVSIRSMRARSVGSRVATTTVLDRLAMRANLHGTPPTVVAGGAPVSISRDSAELSLHQSKKKVDSLYRHRLAGAQELLGGGARHPRDDGRDHVGGHKQARDYHPARLLSRSLALASSSVAAWPCVSCPGSLTDVMAITKFPI